jgi:hypothetical protein
LQKIPLNYTPRRVKCIPTGLVSVIGDNRIEFYFAIRPSFHYLKSTMTWTLIASHEIASVSAIEWTLDGLLLYAIENCLYCFTKFMDTFFLDVPHAKLPTFHHTVNWLGRMVPDCHPSNLIPLLISGRFNLVLRILRFLNAHYDDSLSRWFCRDVLLAIPTEAPGNTVLTNDPSIPSFLESLLAKIVAQPIPELSEKENHQMELILSKFIEIVSIPFDSLDTRGLCVLRAHLFAPTEPLPFDLISLAYLSPDQAKLASLLNLTQWSSFQSSGILFWYADLHSLIDLLVPFAVDCFTAHPFLTIFFLVVSGRLKTLSLLFRKAGDDTRSQFFVRKFSTKKEQSSAEKNGFSALKKQDYHIAAAMFFLAGRCELAMRVIADQLHDPGLHFFAARCADNGIGPTTKRLISDTFLPQARSSDDKAAVAFFERVLSQSSPSLCMGPRFRQISPKNLYPHADFFCDQRFSSCLSLSVSPEDRVELVHSWIISGTALLALPFMTTFNTFVLRATHSEIASPEVAAVSSVVDLAVLRSASSVCELTQHGPRFSTPDAAPQPAALPDFCFGGGLPLDSDDEVSSSDSSPPASAEPPRSTAVLARSYRAAASSFRPVTGSDSDSESEPEEDAAEEAAEAAPNWFTITVVFNIARLRLESFIETQGELTDVDCTAGLVPAEIARAGAHVSSMAGQLQDYVVRSCSRLCFVFRRMLMFPTDAERTAYIGTVCRYLAVLPDQLLAFRLSAQQLTQIARIVRAMIVCLEADLAPEDPFVVGAIATALFILALYDRSAPLMLALLSLNLRAVRAFPRKIADLLQVNAVPPCAAPYDAPHVVSEFRFVSLVDAACVVSAPTLGKRQEGLPVFARALVDFMLVDTFMRAVADLAERAPPPVFVGLLIHLRKLHDVQTELLTFATLGFPAVAHLCSLDDIHFDGQPALAALVAYLCRFHDRTRLLPRYCRNLLDRFSEARTRREAPPPAVVGLPRPRRVFASGAPVRAMCMNYIGTALLVATASGVTRVIPADGITRTLSDETSLVGEISVGDEMQGAEQGGEDAPEERPTLHAAAFFGEIDRRAGMRQIRIPLCAAAHPADDYAVLADSSGSLWVRTFDESAPVAQFNVENAVPCASLLFSGDGGAFGAVHGSSVRLWSFCWSEFQTVPFTTIDTRCDETIALSFLSGTGLLATAQLGAPRADGKIVFWDALMPSYRAMVATVTTERKHGHPECLAYSSRYRQLLVGTATGHVCVVDTRQFQVLARVQVAEGKRPGVSAIALDEKQSHFVTGTADGTLKIWDVRTTKIRGEMRAAHKPKAIKGHDRTATFGITSLLVKNDVIYTGGGDGLVNAVAFTA